MEPLQFLRDELERIAKAFPNVHIKYGYDKIIFTHIIELLPITEYRFNKALDSSWIPLSFEFKEKFPKEEIAFVSSDSILSLGKPIFELNIPCIDEFTSNVFSVFSKKELNYTFPTSMSSIDVKSIGAEVGDLLKFPTQILPELETEFDLSYLSAA